MTPVPTRRMDASIASDLPEQTQPRGGKSIRECKDTFAFCCSCYPGDCFSWAAGSWARSLPPGLGGTAWSFRVSSVMLFQRFGFVPPPARPSPVGYGDDDLLPVLIDWDRQGKVRRGMSALFSNSLRTSRRAVGI